MPESGSVMRYLRESHQVGCEQMQNAMAGCYDAVVEIDLRQRGATFSFRSGQVIQVPIADFFSTMQRNVAATSLAVSFYNDRTFFQAERIWRFFMRGVQHVSFGVIKFLH